MDWPSLYAIGAFIQGLRQNPGLEATLQELGLQAHVYVGTGLGNIGKLYDASIELHQAQRRWDRFWSEPERNSALRKHLAAHGSDPVEGVPPAPAAAAAAHADPDAREAAVHVWQRYWADRSPELAQYLAALAAIEKTSITGSVESGKVHVIRARDAAARQAAAAMGRARRAVGGLGRRRVEPPQHAGGAGVDARQHHRAGVRAGGRLLDVRRRAQARDGRDPARRGQGGRGRRHRSAAAPAHRRRLLQRPRARRGRPRVAAADAAARHPRRRRIGGLDPRRLRLHDGARLPRARHGADRGRRQLGRRPHHHADAGRPHRRHRAGAGRRRRGPGRHRHLGSARHRDARRLQRGEADALDAAAHRAGHGAQGDVRARDERRQRLGADRAVSRLRARQAVSDRAARERAQPGHRGAARQLRARQGLRGAAGPRRQALARRRRHQRLRDLAAVAGRRAQPLPISIRSERRRADRCRWPVGRRPATRPRRWRSRAAPRRRRSPDRAA